MPKWLHDRQTRGYNWPDGIRVGFGFPFIGATEVSGNTEDVFEILRKRRVPTARIERRLKMRELISTENLKTLGTGGQSEQPVQGTQKHKCPDRSPKVEHGSFLRLMSCWG